MLKTTFEGEEILHRILWVITEREAKLCDELTEGWLYPSVVAMVFAFHTVEAYLNYVGERLAPDIWTDERNFFRRKPYRGWDGKLRKVMELAGVVLKPEDRPLKTILELKELRNLIAHGKPEKLTGEVIHPHDTDALPPISTLRQMVIPKEKLKTMLPDVEQFLNQVHALAAPKVTDIGFGSEAVHGALQYNSFLTTLNREGV
jgi:hypothetical protein